MLFIDIYLISLGNKEPEDKQLYYTVTILINTHIRYPRHNVKSNIVTH